MKPLANRISLRDALFDLARMKRSSGENAPVARSFRSHTEHSESCTGKGWLALFQFRAFVFRNEQAISLPLQGGMCVILLVTVSSRVLDGGFHCGKGREKNNLGGGRFFVSAMNSDWKLPNMLAAGTGSRQMWERAG